MNRFQALLQERLCNPPWRFLYLLGRLPILGASATGLIVVPLYARLLVSIKTWLDDSNIQVLAEGQENKCAQKIA